jgi:hypothetical protein
MTVLGFSGESRELSQAERAYVIRTVLERVKYLKPEAVVTGGAAGVDTLVAMAIDEWVPSIHQMVCYPTRIDCRPVRWNAALKQDLPHATFHAAQPGHTDSDAYMNRNDDLVYACERLIAFPATRAVRIRSGTWATVRRARRLDMPIEIWPLSEAKEQQ